MACRDVTEAGGLPISFGKFVGHPGRPFFDNLRYLRILFGAGTPLVRFLGGGWLGNPRQENESMTLVSQRNGSPDFHLLPYFGLDFFDEKFFCHRQSASPG
jgi:hypothetical protein